MTKILAILLLFSPAFVFAEGFDVTNISLMVPAIKEPPEDVKKAIDVTADSLAAPDAENYRLTIASNLTSRVVLVYLACEGTDTVIRRVPLRMFPTKDEGMYSVFVAKPSPVWNVVIRYIDDAPSFGTSARDYLFFSNEIRPSCRKKKEP